MKFSMTKRYGTFIPTQDVDKEMFDKLKDGDHIVKVGRIRCPARHREFFGCASIVLANLPENADINCMDDFLFYIKMLIVRKDWEMDKYESIGGRINKKGHFVPKSIAWDKMDEDDFEKWRNRAYPIMAKMIGLTADELLAEYSGNDLILKR